MSLTLFAQTNPATFFANTSVPAVLNGNAGAPIELGMKFTADKDGYISGVRFYKGSNNVGTHIGSLWTSTGDLLAQATFTGETASGWQQVNFDTPVKISANTVYVTSYHSGGPYSYDLSYFFSAPLDNPPLHALSGALGNGVYAYSAGSAFPTVAAAGANFWVDAVFSTSSAPPPPPPPPPPPASGITLFSDSATPAVINADGGAPLELGLKFTADVNGYVAGVRFYKGPNNTGPHVGSLWTSSGQLLAQAIFTGETASGWQQMTFASPVPIAPNTVYVISYHSIGGFSYTLGYFNSPVDNPPLHAVANANGVYAYGANSTFPSLPVGAANFWVDVVFTTPSQAALSSIAVNPATATLAATSTLQYQAVGTYSDGSTKDLTSQVTWSSSNTAAAGINSSGLALGINAGTTVIKAALGSINGTANLTVTGSGPPPPPPPPPPPGTDTFSLFPNTAVPQVADINAGGPLELGLKFTADQNGYVTGVRFYKSANNGGTHVASLWSVSGQLLAQATFSGETASGWQQVLFTSPVAITGSTVYIVSYHSSGHYSYTPGYFFSPVDNPPLHAVNGASGNGIYSYGASSVFPANSAAGANFWVDVVYAKQQ